MIIEAFGIQEKRGYGMDLRDTKRMDLLEKRLRWQKRVLVGLIAAFLFTSSPALSTATKWFDRVFSSRAVFTNLLSGISIDRSGFSELSEIRNEMLSKRAEIFPAETQDGGLSKTAHAVGDILQVSQVQIVNEKGTAVIFIGSDTNGNGGVWVMNKDGKEISWLGGDKGGHGALSIRNASEKYIAGISSDGTDKANGMVVVEGELRSASLFGVNEIGHAFIAVSNKNGTYVSGVGSDKIGHGLLSVSNTSGKQIAFIGAHNSGEGNGVVGALGDSGVFAELAVSKLLGASMRVSNKNGKAVSVMGADENGHSTLR